MVVHLERVEWWMGKWDGNQRNSGLKRKDRCAGDSETGKPRRFPASSGVSSLRRAVPVRGRPIFLGKSISGCENGAAHLNPKGEWTPDYSEPDGENVRWGGYCKVAGLDERKSVAGAILGNVQVGDPGNE